MDRTKLEACCEKNKTNTGPRHMFPPSALTTLLLTNVQILDAPPREHRP